MVRVLGVKTVVIVGVAAIGLSVTALAQTGSVRVTATRANIRSDASETSTVLTQVTQGTLVELLAVEGDWFHVRLQMGSLRVDAYISKKVAKIETSAPASPAPAAPFAGAPAKAAVESHSGMSVLITVGGVTTRLAPTPARFIQIADRVDAIGKLAASLPAGDAPPPGASGAAAVTYVWITDGAAAAKTFEDSRPAFAVEFKEVPGLSPDDLSPALVRLTPAASGVRAIAAVRGRADSATRPDMDWDVMKDLKQDLVRADLRVAERGAVLLKPLADLAPGQYAVVIRPSARKKLSGQSVLGTTGEARVFAVLWDFAIK